MHTRETFNLIHPRSLTPEDFLRFIQMPTFSRQWDALRFSHDDLSLLEMMIMIAPAMAPLRNGGGVRKLRFSKGSDKRGKSGSFRVFYALFPDYGTVLLLSVLDKSDRSDLSGPELQTLSDAVRRAESILEKGTHRHEKGKKRT
jgi:mRNA-degrading endonuclease RelE of RelBE toxin-antitoxin system